MLGIVRINQERMRSDLRGFRWQWQGAVDGLITQDFKLREFEKEGRRMG